MSTPFYSIFSTFSIVIFPASRRFSSCFSASVHAYALMMCFFYNDLMSLFYPLMMAFLPPSFGIAAPFKTNNTLYFAILFAIPAAELIFHIILLALRSKKVKK